jgi:hypothetical protein
MIAFLRPQKLNQSIPDETGVFIILGHFSWCLRLHEVQCPNCERTLSIMCWLRIADKELRYPYFSVNTLQLPLQNSCGD